MGPVTNSLAILAVMSSSPADRPNIPAYTSIAAIDSLSRIEVSPATVRATLTLSGNPSYIQDSTGGAEVDGLSAQSLKIGDELLVTGDASETETGLVFRNSRASLLWHGTPVPALSVTADEAAMGKFVAVLIEVHGQLVDSEIHDGETWLRLQSGHQIFFARLKAERGSSLLPRIERHSLLRLRGVCSVEPRDTRYQGSFAVLLRSAEDIVVVSGPPWWSLKHLSELAIVLGSLIVAGHLALVQMLKARFRAVMAERAKLGHELHDTLAQSFAGLSYQIQAARKAAPPANSMFTRHLDVALDMVRHSHSEAHRSIMMLRPQSLAEGADLHSAIRDSLDQSTAGCHLDARFTTHGSAPRLPLIVTDTLYRIAQEAIANVLRHAHASTLEVTLHYTPASVCLSVTDNGVGFDVKSLHGHGFGLAGMRERVRALRGNISIASEQSKGTCIRVEIYLRHSSWARLISLLHRWRSYCRERLLRMFVHE